MAVFGFGGFMYFGSTLEAYLLFFASIAVGLIAARVLYYFIRRFGGALTARTTNKFDDLVIEAIGAPLSFAGFIAGLFVGYQFLTPDIRFVTDNFANAVNALIILDLAWLVLMLADGFLDHIVMPITKKTRSPLDDQVLPLVRKLVKFTIVSLALLIVLSSFGIDVLPLLAGLGIGGLAIAFAAQKTVEDLFGGLSIFASKPFVVGDTVRVKGIEGDVESVGLRYTRIRDPDGRLATIPNAQVVQDVILNISSERGRRVQMTLGLAYDTPAGKLDEAIRILRHIATEHKDTLHGEDDVRAVFRNYGASSLDIWFVYWIRGQQRKFEVMGEINTEIKRRFEKAGIEFAFPTQTVMLESRGKGK